MSSHTADLRVTLKVIYINYRLREENLLFNRQMILVQNNNGLFVYEN